MIRLLCLNPFFAFAAQSSASAKYVIKKGAYLVEAPPKRPVSSYALFVKDNTAGKKHLKIETSGPELSKKWKLYPEYKEKYTKLSKEKSVGYDQLKQQYEKKYVIPFKRITAHNLRMKSLFDEKKIDMKVAGSLGDKVKKALEVPRSIESEEKFKAEAQKLKHEREAQRKIYQFPQFLTPTLRSYRLRHALPESERGPTYDQDMEAAFKAEHEKWKASVKKWLEDNKYQLTIDEFLTLVEKEAKAKKKAKKEGQYDSDY